MAQRESATNSRLADATLLSDMIEWHAAKYADVRRMIRDIADASIAYHSGTMAVWDAEIAELERELSAS